MTTSARPEGARLALAERPSRVVVEAVSPEVDGGRFPAKRTVGEKVVVEADVYAEGHDTLTAMLRWRPESSAEWTELPMEPLGNDRWRGSFTPSALEPHRYTVEGWVDGFRTWRAGLAKRVAAQQVEEVDLLVGAELVEAAAGRAQAAQAVRLRAAAAALRGGEPIGARARPLRRLVRALPPRGCPGARAPRHAARRGGPAALRGGDGVRRPVPPARPPRRP